MRICINIQKISLFHLFIPQIQSILESHRHTSHTHFWAYSKTPIFDHGKPKHFQSTFNFCEFVSTCKKWGCFLDWFWTNNWLKNLTNWLAESILAYTSGTRFFPKYRICVANKKRYFLAHFPNSKNPGLIRTTW